ncbi:hypothetical protein PsorP6_000291 [Peronosclerospora sorghi]|uniref:Uncharacterized protein n=1 Tax=Peronosclerospora sorghi TaxID=230839 RepID=A0ACC0WWB5_9STRA|nr:hypothetical protein PsorP6_000291 [Peronosclerospora sorghi]
MYPQQRFVALEFPASYGSNVIKHLAEHFQPLSALGFAHLKRLKKHQEVPKTLVALVCPATTSDETIVTPHNEFKQLETMFEARLTMANALKFAPRTRQLFEKHTKQWPLIFHSSVDEAAVLPPIEEDETKKIATYLRLAVDVGKMLSKERQKTLSCARGCIIVDPEVDEHIATSNLNHKLEIKYKFETLYHPVMVAIDAVAERDRRREKAVSTATARKKIKGDDLVDQPTLDKDDEKTQKQSYLCTGYDVYLDCEPCAMCSMALVHSRVRRVIFDRANPSDGVLVSSFKLHTIKSLNHHYRVFQLELTSREEATT